jgi:hypothetical protein
MRPILIVGGLVLLIAMIRKSAGLLGLLLGFLLVFPSGGDYFYPGLRLISPDGKHAALFFGTGGGGAAGWENEFVAVTSSQQKFDTKRYALRMRHGYQVCFRWLSNSVLMVEYPRDAVLELAEGSASGVKIQYEPRDSNYGKLVVKCKGRLAELGAEGSDWRIE